jgi:hypothetical protein
MDTIELDERLREMGFKPGDYSIGAVRDESLILLREDRMWKVFYSERGQRLGLTAFVTEAKACEHMLQLIRSWEGKYSRGKPPS